jgi:hypothetical protein
LFYLGTLYAQLQQPDDALKAFRAAAALGQQINFAPLIDYAEKEIENLTTEET